MAHVLKETQFYLHIPHPSTNRINHTCLFVFPAKAGPHLQIPEGWKAELAWVHIQLRVQWI